ncbi:MAG TPA: hypothetical protein PKL85_01410 [Bacteroidia bacterium]|nr:hypothetical protein [Bacteroidia bacterium]
MDNKKHTIPGSGPCPDQETLVRYARGLSSLEEIRVVELHLADCPLCSDAVDGMMAMDTNTDLTNDILDLNSRIDAAVAPKGKLLFIRPWMKMAASIALICVCIGSLYFILRSEKDAVQEKTLANAEPKVDSLVPANLANAALSKENQASVGDVDLSRKMVDKKISADTASPIQSAEQDDNVRQEDVYKKTSPAPPSVNAEINNELKSIALNKEYAKSRDIVDARNLAVPTQPSPSSKLKIGSSNVEYDQSKKNADVVRETKDEESLVAASGVSKSKEEVYEKSFSAKDKQGTSAASEETRKPSVTDAGYSVNESTTAQSILPQTFRDAVRFYEKGNYKKALPIFESTAKSDSVHANESLWYQALIYLKLNKPDKSRTLLHKLSAESADFKLRADSVLKTLN